MKQSMVDNPSSMNYLYIEDSPAMRFNRPGTIKAWNLYSTSAANIKMMVVRPYEDMIGIFTVVGINSIRTPNGTAAIIPVPTADRIRVEARDVIAWYYMPGSNPTIP